MAMFSAVLFLWILDATSILRFRSEWVSRSVYGAAIASILGTSVGVYRDAFADSKYPYDGLWDVTIIQTGQTSPLTQHRFLMGYSRRGETYWGLSDTHLTAVSPSSAQATTTPVWIEVTDFLPGQKRMIVEMHCGLELTLLKIESLTLRDHATGITGTTEKKDSKPQYEITFQRPK
jgi:hypothetical protein